MTKRNDFWVIREYIKPPLYHAWFSLDADPQSDNWEFVCDVPEKVAKEFKDSLSLFRKAIAKYPGHKFSFELIKDKGVVVFEITAPDGRPFDHEQQMSWSTENRLKNPKIYYCGPWIKEEMDRLEAKYRPVMIYPHN